ncbi:hypothetical protein B7463_g6898, partial [Scytalidium lignicola]
MAEVAGLVIGGVGLAAVFTTCVDCFEYVQVGREFGGDYERCLLKLDIVKLRLSRWGDAINTRQGQPGVIVGNSDEAEIVKKTLGSIIDRFATAEAISSRFRPGNTSTALVTTGPNSAAVDLDPSLQAMRNKIQEQALKRQNRSTFRQKAAWVFRDKARFDHLLEDVTYFVTQLVELFPMVKADQQALAAQDARALENQPRIVELAQVAEDTDEMLHNSAQKLPAVVSHHKYLGNTAQDKAEAQYGNRYEGSAAPAVSIKSSHEYRENIARDAAKVQYGDIYK